MGDEESNPNPAAEVPEYVAVAEGDTNQPSMPPTVAPENVKTGSESDASVDEDQTTPSDEEQVESLQQTPASVLDGDDNESQDSNIVIESDVEE